MSFSLYRTVLSSFIYWEKLTKLNRSFCPVLPITPLILKSFNDKLVWFKYASSLMKGIYVIPVAAESVLVSVLPTYWFCCCCWAVPLPYVTSSGVCCSCSLVWTLFSSCSLQVLHQYCYPQTSSRKTTNLAKLFSAPLVPYPHHPWYPCMLFVSIGSAFFCLIQCLTSLQCLPQIVPTIEATL